MTAGSLNQTRLAKEKGSVRKDWGGKIAIALVFPNTYWMGMSNLGLQIVYERLNRKENVVAERVFLPEDHESSLPHETAKGILSLESLSPLQKFHLIAFSLSFENDYPNILKILQMGRIPLLQKERDRPCPFVMAGGVATFLNPEPLAPFFDFFLLGEAEANLDDFLILFEEVVGSRATRDECLKSLAMGLQSVYVPSLYKIVYHKDGTIASREPTESDIPERVVPACRVDGPPSVNISTVITPETTFSERVLIELGRGCGRSCRFCAAGHVYRPPRIHEEALLIATVDRVLEEHRKIGLLSAAVSDTPGIEHITGLIVERGGEFSVSSLRADSLSESLLDHLKRAGQKTVAIAPEAGSERLRRVINKHLSTDQIIHAVRLIGRIHAFTLRLYFLIGLPTETQEDVAEIVDLVKVLKHHLVKESKDRGQIGQIKLSVNCFVPKAFTPFQWFPMEHRSVLRDRQRWLQKSLARIGGVKINVDVARWAYVQTLLSVGDRRVGSILLLAHEHEGNWQRAFRLSHLNPDFFVYRPKGLDEVLPWDFMDHGIRKEYLLNEYHLALKGKESDTCRVGECERCGVCTFKGMAQP